MLGLSTMGGVAIHPTPAMALEAPAPNITVKGQVVDDMGEPLTGATIKVKGTATGTITDLDGNFELSVDPNATLEVSYVGFQNQDVQVNGRTSLPTIKMASDSEILEQVVVVGYGTQKKADLTGSVAIVNADEMKALVALAKEKFGKIDAVFANAGIMPAGNMSELKVADWNAMIEINIKGVLNTMAAVLPEFIAQKRGHILVTSSRAGMMSVPGNAVYCGTKHFVRAMLDSFRSESIREGTNIRTTTIYPGAIKTELLNTVAESEAKNMVSQFYENVGLTPDVIANAVLYAVSQPDNVAVPDLVVCPSMEG